VTTFHEALRSLRDAGPGAQCDDCGHFAHRHLDSRCRFPRPEDNPCRCKGMKWQGQRFRMDLNGPNDYPSITCPVCDMTSWNPNDVEMGFCGNCHGYTGVVDPMMKARRFVEATRRVDNLDLGDDPDGDMAGYDGG
jgi:hypothetical protein